MKQVMAIPLILIMLVKPLWPIAEYIINYDYIVTNLCENRDRPQLQCDGKCYLAKMLAEESGQQQDNPFEGHQLNSDWIPFLHCPTTNAFDVSVAVSEIQKNPWRYINKKNTPPFINQPTPPPKTHV
ncbi:hypothetical protein [Allomuricauda sp. d1]|uniref:hypothetical protein n=1 Tax=Allomuricauda sp. d1 TaxID=3136725 RepID=UPI0031DD2604